MSETLKVSGKKVSLPSPARQKWKFEVRPGGWIIAQSTTGIRRRFMLHQAKGRLSASLRGFLWTGEKVIDSSGTSRGGADSDLVAQFPGKVRKILVNQDTLVQEGDPLILVEAMKMEFAIRAPYSGRVSKVLVKEGQQISPGDQFVELEAVRNGD